jgi:hypothetical protein
LDEKWAPGNTQIPIDEETRELTGFRKNYELLDVDLSRQRCYSHVLGEFEHFDSDSYYYPAPTFRPIGRFSDLAQSVVRLISGELFFSINVAATSHHANPPSRASRLSLSHGSVSPASSDSIALPKPVHLTAFSGALIPQRLRQIPVPGRLLFFRRENNSNLVAGADTSHEHLQTSSLEDGSPVGDGSTNWPPVTGALLARSPSGGESASARAREKLMAARFARAAGVFLLDPSTLDIQVEFVFESLAEFWPGLVHPDRE